MIEIRSKGSFHELDRWLKKLNKLDIDDILHYAGQDGVEALMQYTPKSTGETAYSWSYKVWRNKKGCGVTWSNSHVENGVNIAVIIQHGHATKNGGWVEGTDYLNPALRPIFEDIKNHVWKEVKSYGKSE